MKLSAITTGLVAGLALGQAGMAQQASAPAQAPAAETQQAPSPVALALQGLHVAVLKNEAGGLASVQDKQGNDAVLTFLDPAAARAAKADAGDASMTVTTLPLAVIFDGWDGPVLFEGSQDEVAHAKELKPDVQTFVAPVYFVMSGGGETQMNTPDGPITPILLSYEDAAGMASRLQEQGEDASTIEIVPLEMMGVLQQLSALEDNTHYRFFTHPETVAFIQAQQPPVEGASQQ